jgi:hypothetical protein
MNKLKIYIKKHPIPRVAEGRKVQPRFPAKLRSTAKHKNTNYSKRKETTTYIDTFSDSSTMR